MTLASAFRCSAASDARGDAMAGTAPPQSRVLVVHQPGAWGPRGLVESRCDPEVAQRIDAAAAKMGMRLQAVRRPGKHEPGVPAGGYVVAIAETKIDAARTTWWRFDDLSEVAAELETGELRREPIAIDTQPLYLVCTHGRHDPCCALRGRPIAQALHRVRPGRVWETTHLSGDRFAANVLVLPTGELYGRVSEQSAPELVRRVEAGEILPELLRGRIGLAPVAQVALTYAYERLNLVARDALRVTSVRRLDDLRAQVRITAPGGQFAVMVETEIGPATRLTCHGSDHARARAYRAVNIDRAEG